MSSEADLKSEDQIEIKIDHKLGLLWITRELFVEQVWTQLRTKARKNFPAMKIHLTVHLLSSALCWCVTLDEEAVKAREGATATMSPRETKRSAEARVAWLYGPVKPDVQIATVTDGRVRCNYNERFRERLKLDPQTGALTIERLRLDDSATYMFYSMNSHVSSQLFRLDVYSEYG